MKACITLALTVLLAATAIACELEEESSGSPSSGSATEDAATSEPTPRTGFARVGSVEIQVLSIEAFDATRYNTFNDENLRVRVRVQKIKGDEYDFALNEWILVTSAGTGIDWSIFCVDCPDSIDELTLYGDQPVEAYVYFEVPPGSHTFTELRYEPLFSTNKGKIAVNFNITVN